VLAAGGIPLIYLGDEVGTLNDPAYLDDPGKAGDSRWVHRPARHSERYAQRLDMAADAGRIFRGLRRLVIQRAAIPEFGGGRLIGFRAGNPSVLGFTRPGAHGGVLVLANFSERAQPCLRVRPTSRAECATTCAQVSRWRRTRWSGSTAADRIPRLDPPCLPALLILPNAC
jgi:amylosucrase